MADGNLQAQDTQNETNFLDKNGLTKLWGKIKDFFASNEEKKELIAIANGTYEGVNLTEKFADEIADFSDEWAWIDNRRATGNYSGLNLGDYIPTTIDGETYHPQIIGIDTYKGYGEDGNKVGNHIDFFVKEPWKTAYQFNEVNYNNGLIPRETLTGDGTKTSFEIKPMDAIDSITVDGAEATAFTYTLDAENQKGTLVFSSAPTGEIKVVGIGERNPFMASKLYKYMNSLKGQIAKGTAFNPPIEQVNFSEDGVYYFLPQILKNVIKMKPVYHDVRYGTTSIQTGATNAQWDLMGPLWTLSEIEAHGTDFMETSHYGKRGYIKYPFFNSKCKLEKLLGSSPCAWWSSSVAAGNSTHASYMSDSGAVIGTTTSSSNVGIGFGFRI